MVERIMGWFLPRISRCHLLILVLCIWNSVIGVSGILTHLLQLLIALLPRNLVLVHLAIVWWVFSTMMNYFVKLLFKGDASFSTNIFFMFL